MENQSKINKRAWSYRANEFWMNNLGKPSEVAQDMLHRPDYYLRKHIDYLGDIRGKKVINLLGSSGKKAIPLAILGADVTIIDISEENMRYATQVAKYADVDINYIVSDFMELNIDYIQKEFDITYLEGGILHYFSDLNSLAIRIHSLLKAGGKLVLNDKHPFHKLIRVTEQANEKIELSGNYFDEELIIDQVAYESFFPSKERDKFPKCLLRYWTIGEIITAFASAGFIIERLDEMPRYDCHKNIPGEFTLVAIKNKKI